MKLKILIILLTVLFSCTVKSEKDYPIGKWASSIDREYVEMQFDSNEIYVYSHWGTINRNIRYTFMRDSLYYIDYNYFVKYIRLNDTTIILSVSGAIDTLYRLNDTVVTYQEIDHEDSVQSQIFWKKFNKRADSFYSKKGIRFLTDEMDSTWIPEDEILVQ